MSFLRLCTRMAAVLFFLFTATVTAYSQTFDYQSRPQFNFDFKDADIELAVNTQTLAIHGTVNYQLEANISGAEKLQLSAAHMQIDTVIFQGKAAKYTLKNDQLSILLADSSVMGQQYQLQITYHSTPQFGLLKDSEGTVWTSLLPLSNRHWVPMVDHPRVRMRSTLSLIVPFEYTAIASGVKTNQELLADSTRKVTFRTGRPVPASAISFALGRFHKEGTSYGIKRIISYAEPNTIEPERQLELAEKAKAIIKQIEGVTGIKYPYQRLHVVVLADHFWEQKPYGASTILVYQNRGDLMHQLRRGIYGQWFGVYQREEQWAKAWPMNFFQSVLHYKVADEPVKLKESDSPETNFTTVYENFGIEKWNFWQQYPNWDKPNLQNIANNLLAKLLQSGPGTATPQNYANRWYRFSGQPTIEVPDFRAVPGIGSAGSDAIIYRVDYTLSPARDTLHLAFSAQQGVIEQADTLTLELITGGDVQTSSIVLSGSVDKATVVLPGGVQNARLQTNSSANIIFKEHKPVPYLLYQLRNAESTAVRRQAAIQIGYHTDKPDLQLAVVNAMKQATQPEVKAALLKSYGALTQGAEGTEQRFLEALKSENLKIRTAALEVLSNYEGNDEVSKALEAFFNQGSGGKLSKRAFELYLTQIDSTKMLSFTNTLVQQDTSGTQAIIAVAKLAEMGNTKTAVQLAKYYVNPVFAYPVRRKALGILLKHDSSPERWNGRLKMLLNDVDPRIRYLTIKNLGRIPGANASAIKSTQMKDEYDARVYKLLSRK